MFSSKAFSAKVFQVKNLMSADDLRKKLKFPESRQFFVIYDQELLKIADFKNWLKHFVGTYPVQAGEELKNLKNLPLHIERISQQLHGFPHRDLCFLVVGGGSLGDFGGFVASIYKRGVDLIHLPSTWLAAIDSAHGGKNALNVNQFKNQVGQFYPARAIIISQILFANFPEEQMSYALGELVKIALINNASLFHKIRKCKKMDSNWLWKSLKSAYRSKMKIVGRDPFETLGHRQLLNLGHTLGHALELKFSIPHGWAVAQGVYFSLNWSLERQFIHLKDYEKIHQVLQKYFPEKRTLQGRELGRMHSEELKKVLSADKKLFSNTEINFVFIRSIGKCFIEKVSLEELIQEACRQGWAV